MATARENAFTLFHKRTGLRQFSPEFVESLVAVIREARCLDEAVWAWVRWRSWANSSEACVDHWDPERARPLDQMDCIVDVLWIRGGWTPEEVQQAPPVERETSRQSLVVENRKAQFSRAFSEVEARGNIRIEGRRILAVVAPAPRQEPKVAGTSNFQGDEGFMNWWKVADTSNFEAYQTAYTAFIRARRIARTAHRQYLGQATSRVRILIDVKGSNKSNNNNNSPDKEPATEPSVVVALEPLPQKEERKPEPNPEVELVREALSRHGQVTLSTAAAVIASCREKRPDCRVEWIVTQIQDFAFGRNVDSRIGLLRSELPRRIAEYRPPPPPEPKPAVEICPHCDGTGFLDRFNWGMLPEARAHFSEGAQLCGCNAGALIRDSAAEPVKKGVP